MAKARTKTKTKQPRPGARFPKSEVRLGGDLEAADNRVTLLQARIAVLQTELAEAVAEAGATRAEIADLESLP